MATDWKRATRIASIPVYDGCFEASEPWCMKRKGVHYRNLDFDVPTGPDALYVDNHGHFWILDGVSRRLLSFDERGKFVSMQPAHPLEHPGALIVTDDYAFAVGNWGDTLVVLAIERATGKLMEAAKKPDATLLNPDRRSEVMYGGRPGQPHVIPVVKDGKVAFDPVEALPPADTAHCGPQYPKAYRIGDIEIVGTSCLGLLAFWPDGSFDLYGLHGLTFRFDRNATYLGAHQPPEGSFGVSMGASGPGLGPDGHYYALVPHRRRVDIIRLNFGAAHPNANQDPAAE